MDGTIAVLFMIAGLTDMITTDCRTDGCLAQSDATARASVAVGDVLFQESVTGEEVFLRYDMGRSYGPFQPTMGVSMTTSGDAWIGIGAIYDVETGFDRFYTELSLMPGIYARGNGAGLGHEIEFRSIAEVGYEARNGIRVGLSFDHRSNAGLSSTNPGLETFQLRVSMPVGNR